jgi:CDP-diacylglycerol---serine O-phosphatidyltransferase
MKIFKYVHNTLTCLNLACGFLAIILAFQTYMQVYAAYLIFLAAIFDFLDGLSARMLNEFSELGKQLDSLADVVSFGIAPGILVYQLITMSLGIVMVENKFFEILFLCLSVFIPIFSALRLAKFNIDERQVKSFIGLPTPPSALLIASYTIVLFFTTNMGLQEFLLRKSTLTIIILLDSYLLVSNLPMFSLKIDSFSLKGHVIQYLFLGVSLIMLLILKVFAFPLIIALYVLLSLIAYLIKPKPVVN